MAWDDGGRGRWAAAACWLAIAQAGLSQVAVQDFTNGVALTNMAGWAEETAGLASLAADPDPLGAAGALRLDPTNLAARVSRAVLGGEGSPWPGGTSAVAFGDFWVRPAAEPPTNAATRVDLDGARVGFVLDGASGRAFVFDGDGWGGGAIEDTGFTFPVGAGGASSNWVRVTIRRDFGSPQYDAWFDGVLYAASVGPDETNAQSAPALFCFEGAGSAPAWLDLYSLGPDNPLFPDADRDGMPDAFESSRGLDPYADDRDGDADGDGAGNFGEYAMGTSPDDPGSAPSTNGPALLYVDAEMGDDLFNGLASHPGAGGGPKRTIGAGMGAAAGFPEVTISIRGSTNAYAQGSIGPATNAVVLRPIGNVRIQP